MDYGRYLVTKNPKDSLLFKVPSLRNLSSLSHICMMEAPHIKQVIQHYMTLDVKNPLLSNDLSRPLNLSSKDQINRTAFY